MKTAIENLSNKELADRLEKESERLGVGLSVRNRYIAELLLGALSEIKPDEAFELDILMVDDFDLPI